MKNNARSLSRSAVQLTAVKQAASNATEQIRSAYLQAILSGSRIASPAEIHPREENPDLMSAIRYIRRTASFKKK